MSRVVYSLVALVAVGISQAQAGAIAINFFSVGFSSAHGAIWTPFGPAPIGMSDGRSSGPRLGPTAASASLTHPVTGFHVDASARTSGAVGIDVHAHAFGNFRPLSLGVADLLDPFENPIQPVPDQPGDADLLCDASVDGSVLILSGKGDNNVNGYLELAVLNIGTMDPKEAAQILTDAGSVEKALAQGTFPKEQVLAKYREDQLAGGFTIKLDLGSVPPEQVAVSGLAHVFTQSSGN